MNSMPRPLVLISACLCGERCRYNGEVLSYPRFERLVHEGLALAVCPEVLGGLGVPRPPCEIRGGRVIAGDAKDVTEAFEKGARAVLAPARQHGIRAAVFKERSPSCGSGHVYDGSFSGRLVPGAGLAAALLMRHGIAVCNEETATEELLREMLRAPGAPPPTRA